MGNTDEWIAEITDRAHGQAKRAVEEKLYRPLHKLWGLCGRDFPCGCEFEEVDDAVKVAAPILIDAGRKIAAAEPCLIEHDCMCPHHWGHEHYFLESEEKPECECQCPLHDCPVADCPTFQHTSAWLLEANGTFTRGLDAGRKVAASAIDEYVLSEVWTNDDPELWSKAADIARGDSEGKFLVKALAPKRPRKHSSPRFAIYGKDTWEPAWYQKIGFPFFGFDEWGRATAVIGLWFIGYFTWAYRTCWCQECHEMREQTYRWAVDDDAAEIADEDTDD